MSESSEDKTKRRYVEKLLGHSWGFQYSIFYKAPEESINLLKHLGPFKQYLRRKYKQPFLIRTHLKNGLFNGKRLTWAYLVIFTTDKLEEFKDYAELNFYPDINVLYRKVSKEDLQSKARSILAQKPHNLKKFFNSDRVTRWTILNENRLIG